MKDEYSKITALKHDLQKLTQLEEAALKYRRMVGQFLFAARYYRLEGYPSLHKAGLKDAEMYLQAFWNTSLKANDIRKGARNERNSNA